MSSKKILKKFDENTKMVDGLGKTSDTIQKWSTVVDGVGRPSDIQDGVWHSGQWCRKLFKHHPRNISCWEIFLHHPLIDLDGFGRSSETTHQSLGTVFIDLFTLFWSHFSLYIFELVNDI